MGLLCGIGACIIGIFLSRQDLGMAYGFLLLFFVVRSRLAFYQVRAFSEERYSLLILTGLAIVAAVWLGRSLVDAGTERLEWYVLVLLAAFAALAVCSLRGLRTVGRGSMLSLADWLQRLRLLQRPVRLRVASLSRDAEDWLVHALTRKIQAKVRASGEMARIGPRRIAWYESGPTATSLREDTILRYGGGLIDAVRSTPLVDNGQKALSLARQTRLMDCVLDDISLEQASPLDIEDLKNQFCTRFPNAVLYDAGLSAPLASNRLSRRDCRRFMAEALRYSKDPFRRARKARFEVTALSEGGRIRLILGIPQSHPRPAREAWRSFISRVNVSRAFSQNTQPRKGTFMSPTPFMRAGIWLVGLTVPALLLSSIPVPDRVTGAFLLKTPDPIKVYAPVDGFLKSLACQPEAHLAAGSTIASLEIPDLAGRLTRKRAELKKAEALERLGSTRGRPAGSQSDELEPAFAESPASSNPAEAGARPELLDVERAEVERLQAELAYLEQLQKGQTVLCPIEGVLAAPDRAQAKTSAFVRAGELICEVVPPDRLIVEISLPEQAASQVVVGQRVELKARSLPYETFKATLDRVAPKLERGETGRRIRVFCSLEHPPGALRPGMSGFARIYLGRRAAASVFLDRVLRFVRVEFWW